MAKKAYRAKRRRITQAPLCAEVNNGFVCARGADAQTSIRANTGLRNANIFKPTQAQWRRMQQMHRSGEFFISMVEARRLISVPGLNGRHLRRTRRAKRRSGY